MTVIDMIMAVKNCPMDIFRNSCKNIYLQYRMEKFGDYIVPFCAVGTYHRGDVRTLSVYDAIMMTLDALSHPFADREVMNMMQPAEYNMRYATGNLRF